MSNLIVTVRTGQIEAVDIIFNSIACSLVFYFLNMAGVKNPNLLDQQFISLLDQVEVGVKIHVTDLYISQVRRGQKIEVFLGKDEELIHPSILDKQFLTAIQSSNVGIDTHVLNLEITQGVDCLKWEITIVEKNEVYI